MNAQKQDNFVHLHLHGQNSLLDGLGKESEYVIEAVRIGQPALALTDHGNLAGLHPLYAAVTAAQKEGHEIHAIAGCEFYVVPSIGTIDSKEPLYLGDGGRDDVSSRGAYTHLTVLAENNVGLKNLFHLSKIASLRGFYKKPRISLEVLAEHAEGLIVTTGCPSGEVQTNLRLQKYDAAKAFAAKLVDIVGKGNVFVELMDHGMKQDLERKVRAELLQIAMELDLPIVATNDAHYVTHNQAKTHEELLAIQTRAKMSEAPDYEGGSRFAFEGGGSYYLKTAAEMARIFPDLPEALSNTLLIAERAKFEVKYNDITLRPTVPIPAGYDEHSWLREECMKGFARRLPEKMEDPVYLARLEKELSVLKDKNFSSYFLVVSDMLRWAKFRAEPKIPMGPGRGSAAGSLVAFLTDITDADPIRFDLLFERFLNPERDSPPDVDIDIADRDRPRLIEYVTEAYGPDMVAQVITYGTIGAKAAIKDVARIYEYPIPTSEALSKALPPPIFGKEIHLSEVYDPSAARYPEAAEFRELVEKENLQGIIEPALKLEGRVRSHGKHAAAVIISNKNLADVVPLGSLKSGERPITLWDYPTAEAMGLIKMDFLGLRNLSIMQDAVKNIKRTKGVDVDLSELILGPMNDQKTYQMLQRGDSLGVFQLDGSGMRSLMKLLKPSDIEDISALVALYRPGPMGAGAHTDYALRKNGLQEPVPIHPEFKEPLKDVLGTTHEIILYQEQIQRMAQIVAGYSLAEADLLRRAMGKKKRYIIDAEFANFKPRALEHGYSEEAIQALWDVVVPFADYAFNKCLSDRTTLRLGDGTPVKAREVYNMHKRGEAIELQAMWPDGEIKPHAVANVVSTGMKQVARLKTASGRTVEATLDHRLLTTRGYQKLEDMRIGMDELIVADRISTPAMAARAAANIRKAHGKPLTQAQLNARSANMIKTNERSERAEQDARAAERMRAYQSTLTFEDRSAHQKQISLTTNRTSKVVPALRAGIIKKYETDPEFRQQIVEHLARVRYVAEGVGFGKKCFASNGMPCDSLNEKAMAEFLIELGIEFDMHKFVGRGQCDFYFEGLYWEMDGMDRHPSYFERKYGDLPYVVVTPEDYKERISDVLKLDHARNGDLIVGIEVLPRKRATIDIQMAEDGPKNFLTWKGIVSHNSHSLAYGLTAYATAYLKANYPTEYMAALLTSTSGNKDKTAEYLEDCRQHGIKVMAPDVNQSGVDYTPVRDGVIVFGFKAIKGVGDKPSTDLVAWREENGKFTSFNDYLMRAPKTALNKTVIMALAESGGFDQFGLSRRAILEQLENTVKSLQKLNLKRKKHGDGLSLFDGFDDLEMTAKEKTAMEALAEQIVVSPMQEYPRLEKLKIERERLGLYVSDHPLNGVDLVGLASAKVSELLRTRIPADEEGEEDTFEDPIIRPIEGWPGRNAPKHQIAGILSSWAERRSKKGTKFGVGVIEDHTGSQIEITMFGQAFEKYGEFLKADNIYQVTGYSRWAMNGEDVNFNVEAIRPLEFSDSGQMNVRMRLLERQWGRGKEAFMAILAKYPPAVDQNGNLQSAQIVLSLKDADTGAVREETLDVEVRPGVALTQEISGMFGRGIIGRWPKPRPALSGDPF